MKRIVAFMLAALLLCGCQAQPEATTQPTQVTTVPTTQPTTEPTTAPTTEPTTEPTTAPTEPPVLYRHPLTGQALDAPFTRRPVAISTNNTRWAQPLHGISNADVLYEVITEGGGAITRCLAVYSDVSGIEKLGSIRSARTYIANLARANNAVLVHCGGSVFAIDLLNETGYDHIDQQQNYNYFYRDQARLDAGYAREHTLFTTGKDLVDCIAARKFPMDRENDASALTRFSEDAQISGEAATSIEVQFNPNGKATALTYQAETGCYIAEQRWHGDGSYSDRLPLADENNDVQPGFRNVFTLFFDVTKNPTSVHIFLDMEGSGDGYYAMGGKIVPIKWHRETADGPFTYTLADGTPLVQSVGKSYIAIAPKGSPVIYR